MKRREFRPELPMEVRQDLHELHELLPPDHMTLAAAASALGERLALRERDPVHSDRTFFDTFDGRLHAAGRSVIHEHGKLALLDRGSGAQRAALPLMLPTQPLLARQLPPSALRDALAAIVERRAMLARVRVHCRVTGFDVLDDERKTVVRITLEEPALVSAPSPHTALRPRLRLTPVRGYDEALWRVREMLTGELEFTVVDQPLADEAVRASGRLPAGTSAKVDVPLSADQRADAAAAALLRRLAEVIEDNLEGAVADIDVEFLHDLRVAVRRSRAVQREFKHAFAPAALGRFRAEFRWLQQITSDSRDLDVYVLEFDSLRALVRGEMRPELEPLLEALRTRRVAARREMVRGLRSRRTSRLLEDWQAFLEELVELPTEERGDATRPIAELAGERIRTVYKRMVRMGEAISGSSPAADFHELRKQGKELRYLLELFGAPLYPSEVVKPMIKSLKALQDVLGRHQDREVQVAMLHSLRDEVPALPGGAASLMAMGALVARLGEDEQAARDEFAVHFAVFAAKSQRRLVKDTFG